jgi:hypothetical protein
MEMRCFEQRYNVVIRGLEEWGTGSGWGERLYEAYELMDG